MQKMCLTRYFLDSVLENRVKRHVSRETIESNAWLLLGDVDLKLEMLLSLLLKGVKMVSAQIQLNSSGNALGAL
jgi:hypothetical protein